MTDEMTAAADDAEFDAAAEALNGEEFVEWSICIDALRSAGVKAGQAAASWLLDGNSTKGAAEGLLALIENCGLDAPTPFSGEHADGLTIEGVIRDETSLDFDALTAEEIDEAAFEFETGFEEGYQREAELSARRLLAD